MKHYAGYGQKDKKRIEITGALRNAGGAHGEAGKVYLSRKQKKDGRYTRYIHIYNANSDPAFVADYSAITSEILRAAVSTQVFTKVRVITEGIPEHPEKRTSTGYISKEIDGYSSAFDQLTGRNRTHFLNQLTNNEKIKQLAALFTGVYFSEENDLHNGNWGVDRNYNIVKIDNDQAFFAHTAHYKRLETARYDNNSITSWPNSIFSRSESFPITLNDINNLPNLTHAKPHNWPSNNIPDFQVFFRELSQNPTFIKYKWLYFTKILLTNDFQIDDMCKAHSLDTKKAAALSQHIKNRRISLEKVLLTHPDYCKFLSELDPSTSNDYKLLEKEFETYNLQYWDKTKQNYKPKYISRLFHPEDYLKKIHQLRVVANNKNQYIGSEYELRDSLAEQESLFKRNLQAIQMLLPRHLRKGTEISKDFSLLQQSEDIIIKKFKKSSIAAQSVFKKLFSEIRKIHENIVIIRRKLNPAVLQPRPLSESRLYRRKKTAVLTHNDRLSTIIQLLQNYTKLNTGGDRERYSERLCVVNILNSIRSNNIETDEDLQRLPDIIKAEVSKTSPHDTDFLTLLDDINQYILMPTEIKPRKK